MLSYRHAFHAGNHADVLKHVTLVALLEYLTGKPKPLWVIDTHAGAGMYELNRGFAKQLGEYRSGIGRFWEGEIAARRPGARGASAKPNFVRPLLQSGPQQGSQGTEEVEVPQVVARYLELVRGLNEEGRLRRYPGSPWFARQLTRAEDRLWLYELHPSDFAALGRNVGGKRVRVAREDGLRALTALLPPAPKRALVLIDPSYEVKSDYRHVVATLRGALQRFATGTYAVWYPLLQSPEARDLPDALRKLGAGNWLDARLQVREAGAGMYGSGLFVINPPYTLPETLEPVLDLLVRLLGQDAAAARQLESRID